jgi:hypothetical protein
MTTEHEASIINKDREKQATLMQKHLESMGVEVRIAHYTGDSSYPTEYTLIVDSIAAVGPTIDLALLEFTNRLLIQEKNLEALVKDASDLLEKYHGTIESMYGLPHAVRAPILPIIEDWQKRAAKVL